MFSKNHPHVRKVMLFSALLLLFALSARMAPAQDGKPPPATTESAGEKAREEAPPALQAAAVADAPALMEEIYCSTPNAAIPDNDPGGVSDIMQITDLGTLSDLALQLEIAHTFVGDLRIDLEHTSTGRTANVLNRPNQDTGFCSGDDIDNTISDNGLLDLQSDCNDSNPAYPDTGAYRPAESFELFEGEDINGFWRLVVADNAAIDVGTVVSWCLVSSTETASLTIVKEAGPADGTDFAFESDLPVATYLDQWGGSGSGEGQLDVPLGMAVDGAGNVYVADAFNNRIQKFDAEGNFLLQWGGGGSGEGQFDGPRDVVVDDLGNVYVVDKFNDRVQKFTADGDYLEQWGSAGNGDGQFNDPVGIAVSSGPFYTFYVTDTGNNRVQRFNRDGDYIGQWGSGPSGADGDFNEPKFIDVDAAGNVFVADFGNQRVQKFNSTGTFLLKWGFEDAAWPEGSLNRPEGLTVDDAGNVYVGEWDNARVQVFDNDGNFLSMWGYGVRNGAPSFQVCNGGCRAGVPGSGDGQFENPEGIAVDGRGHIYVSSSTNDRIQKFSSNAFILDEATPDDEDGITQTQVFASVNPGTFFITETVPAGWTLADISCDFQTWEADLPNGALGVELTPGLDGTCTFTNQGAARLTMVKDADPADGTDFTFSSNLPAFVFLDTWGAAGSEEGQFSYAQDAAVDAQGNVYVADRDNERVQKFDPDGHFLLQWGEFGTGDGQLNALRGVALDIDGNVYVADSGNDRIQKFDGEGSYVGQWGSEGSGDGQFMNPGGIAVDANGNVYVTDAGNDRVQKFDGDGGYLDQWGSLGSGNGQFDTPEGIAVDATGNVYVADRFNHRIQKFDGAGNYVGQWGNNGTGDGDFSLPSGVALDAHGDVFVSDTFNHRLQKFDSEGAYLGQWGSVGTGDGELGFPWGITVDRAGNIYVADSQNSRLQKLTSNAFLLDDAVPDDEDGVTERRVFNGLPAGGYEIVQSLPADWSLADITCDSGEWSADVVNQTLVVTLADGDDVICTFANEGPPPAEAGDLTIVLDAAPEDDTPFDFSADGELGAFTLSDPTASSRTFAGIATGDYVVSQTTPPGWSLDGVTCSGGAFTANADGVTVTVGNGADVTCTFSNVQGWTLYLPLFLRSDG